VVLIPPTQPLTTDVRWRACLAAATTITAVEVEEFGLSPHLAATSDPGSKKIGCYCKSKHTLHSNVFLNGVNGWKVLTLKNRRFLSICPILSIYYLNVTL
jgi:hypothetical protein